MSATHVRVASIAAIILASAPLAPAQGPTFSTPGITRQASLLVEGQVSPLGNDFNPAIGAVFDTVAQYLDDGNDSGLDLALRAFEVTLAAAVDPSAWGYAVIVYADDEVELEEAALVYQGFDSNVSLKAGRFFVDFGKQMQVHEHDLRTFERPLVLRSYLGEELGGDGLQLDNWFSVGDSTAVRYSVGVFGSLLGESEGDDPFTPVAFDPELDSVDELALTARLTAFTDIAKFQQLQAGLSYRGIPDYEFELEASGANLGGLSNHVFGADITWNMKDETATKTLTVGGEALLATGDLSSDVDDAGTPLDPGDDLLIAVDDEAFGWFAFVDWAWNRFDSVGVQYSQVELPETGLPDASEVEVYFTHFFSDFHRIRLSASHLDFDGQDDSTRIALQYTGFLGPHSHGVNW